MPYYRLRDGEQIYVRVVGRGRPCLLLHGMSLDSRSLLPFIWPHIWRCRFYLPDLRGFGHSRRCALRADDIYGQQAEDVADLLGQLDQAPFLLGGISLGALVGLQYLATFGAERVARYLHIDHPAHLVLSDAPDIISRELLTLAHLLVGQAEQAGLTPDMPFAALPPDYRDLYYAFLAAVLQHALGQNYQKLAAGVLLSNDWGRELAAWVSSTECWYAVLLCVRGYLTGRFDVRAALGGLDIPITCMIGLQNDLFHLRDLLYVPDHLPNSRLIEFSGSSHLLPLTEPLKFQREFGRFLTD